MLATLNAFSQAWIDNIAKPCEGCNQKRTNQNPIKPKPKFNLLTKLIWSKRVNVMIV